MKRLKWFGDRLRDGLEQYIEFAILVGAMIVPFVFNVQTNVSVDKPDMDVKDLLMYFAVKHGNFFIGMALVGLLIGLFHQVNKDRTINRGNYYHQHTMFWYSLCAKLLGYNTCNLLRVPVATQFKLVLRDTFDHYYTGSEEVFPTAENSEKIIIQCCSRGENGTKQFRWGNQSPAEATAGIKEGSCIYIGISDTYPITANLLPDGCFNQHPAFVIQRDSNAQTRVRSYSPKLVQTVNDFVGLLPNEVEIHICPTTNPKNAFRIAEDVFKTAGRDNVKSLFVHTQPNKNKGDWKFSENGKRIY